MGTIWFRASLALLGVGAFWLAILLQRRPHGSRRKERKSRPQKAKARPARQPVRQPARVRRSRKRKSLLWRGVLLLCLIWALSQAGRELGRLWGGERETLPGEGLAQGGALAAESAGGPDFASLGLEAPILYLEREGKVLYEKNADRPTAPASTTKLLTALTVLDWLDPKTTITVGPEAEWPEPDASRAWLAQGDRMSLRQALIALLLPSGNDAAWTLAVAGGRAIAGQELTEEQAAQKFVEEMNRKAEQLGAEDSHFVRPDGYDAEGQYTTARDLARIGRHALENETLAEILGMGESTETWASGRQVTYQNSNLLLRPESPWYDSRAIGLKTGSTDQAGCCLVSALRLGQDVCLCVVMGDSEEGRWRDTAALFDRLGEG